ncbi:hypothetical protein NXT3_PA00286 (plasmid) [Sinorhizobium fredii]|uniref:Uncharacterized protein n=1 Tax=Rhizobium fredii TaxID=380 RepID=A0A2L0HAW5_RHIFR|nr:hypothetical protein NXT3_PA00286 [Sinorhizobium fredii]
MSCSYEDFRWRRTIVRTLRSNEEVRKQREKMDCQDGDMFGHSVGALKGLEIRHFDADIFITSFSSGANARRRTSCSTRNWFG